MLLAETTLLPANVLQPAPAILPLPVVHSFAEVEEDVLVLEVVGAGVGLLLVDCGDCGADGSVLIEELLVVLLLLSDSTV